MKVFCDVLGYITAHFLGVKGESNKQRRIVGLKKEVFNEDDIKKIKKLALKDFRDNPSNATSTASLGVLLLFNSGLRVGELVAIRERNIFDDYLWIEEEEQRDNIISIDEKTQKVVYTYNGTKVGKAITNASFRKVPLTKEAKEIIKLVLETNKATGFKDEDFLFVNATQRIQIQGLIDWNNHLQCSKTTLGTKYLEIKKLENLEK